jgi:ankyrin repeat protein
MSYMKYVLHTIVITVLIGFTSAWAQTSSFEQALQAAEAGNATAVAGLLDRGVDPNTADKEGNTLLMLASRAQSVPLVKLLISRKAAVDARNAHGDTALMMAALGGFVDVARILIGAGASVNRPGWSALHYGTFATNDAIVRLVLERGADKDALAPNGYSALMLAVRNGNLAAARTLLYADVDVSVEGPRGETAMKLAAARGEREMVDLLKRAGAPQ